MLQADIHICSCDWVRKLSSTDNMHARYDAGYHFPTLQKKKEIKKHYQSSLNEKLEKFHDYI